MSIPSPATVADGLRTNCTGEKNFPLIQQYADGVLTVSEDSIRAAIRALTDALHLEIEPSAAVPYAAVLEGKIPAGLKNIGLILTGGTVDSGSPLTRSEVFHPSFRCTASVSGSSAVSKPSSGSHAQISKT